MQTIRTFTNLADAGFHRSLLEAAGIPALLADEESFALGALMATGGIRLQVEEADVPRALAVLQRGLDADADEALDVGGHPGLSETLRLGRAPGVGNFPVGLFVTIAVFAALLIFALQQVRENRVEHGRSGEYSQEADQNRDGRADTFYTHRGEVLVRYESDRNFDGRLDEWAFCDAQGQYERAEADDNFDGRLDGWSEFENGLVAKATDDTDGNGLPDVFSYYTHGVLSRMDYRPNGDARVLKSERYVHGTLREELVDENRDGTFDARYEYDIFGVRSGRLPVREK